MFPILFGIGVIAGTALFIWDCIVEERHEDAVDRILQTYARMIHRRKKKQQIQEG